MTKKLRWIFRGRVRIVIARFCGVWFNKSVWVIPSPDNNYDERDPVFSADLDRWIVLISGILLVIVIAWLSIMGVQAVLNVRRTKQELQDEIRVNRGAIQELLADRHNIEWRNFKKSIGLSSRHLLVLRDLIGAGLPVSQAHYYSRGVDAIRNDVRRKLEELAKFDYYCRESSWKGLGLDECSRVAEEIQDILMSLRGLEKNLSALRFNAAHARQWFTTSGLLEYCTNAEGALASLLMQGQGYVHSRMLAQYKTAIEDSVARVRWLIGVDDKHQAYALLDEVVWPWLQQLNGLVPVYDDKKDAQALESDFNRVRVALANAQRKLDRSDLNVSRAKRQLAAIHQKFEDWAADSGVRSMNEAERRQRIDNYLLCIKGTLRIRVFDQETKEFVVVPQYA